MASPELTVIIVSYNTRDLLTSCLRSVQRVAGEAELEIIVVDNASFDGSADSVEECFPEVKLLRQTRNIGFAAAMNRGIAAASSPLFMALNPDAVLVPGTLLKLLTFMKDNPQAGAAGAVLTFPNGQLQASIFHFSTLFREFWNFLPEIKGLLRPKLTWNQLTGIQTARQPIQVDCVSGAALIARTEVVRNIGGFDEEFFLYHEELDLCKRLQRGGWEVWLVPEAQVIHHNAKSTGYRANRLPGLPVLEWRLTGMDRFWAKHKSPFQHALWRFMARSLLRFRIVLLSRGFLFSSKYRHRISELAQVVKLLKGRTSKYRSEASAPSGYRSSLSLPPRAAGSGEEGRAKSR
jgi:N-acetylglucosaminyl-diphospho-decaprenol L-rhamnosyltransferase